jgi:hypothetical protein
MLFQSLHFERLKEMVREGISRLGADIQANLESRCIQTLPISVH